MAMAAALRWPLTVLFAVTGVYCVARCGFLARHGVRHPATTWLVEAAHVAMSAAMVAMVWAALGWDRSGVELTVFGLLAGWFGLYGLLGPPRSHVTVVAVARPLLLYEASAMAAMCWMLWSMTPHPDMAGPEMGMAMPGTAGIGGPGALTSAVSATFAVGLAGSGAAWAIRCRRVLVATTRTGGTPEPASSTGSTLFGVPGEAACQALMAAGMAVAVLSVF